MTYTPPSRERVGRMTRDQVDVALAKHRATEPPEFDAAWEAENPVEAWAYFGPLAWLLDRRIVFQAREAGERYRDRPAPTPGVGSK